MQETAGNTHATRTVIELRKKILSGELTGGTRLLEVPLSEELEISRTPLRDAMSRLAEEGLLERGRNGGFTVRRFTFRDVVDAIELRGVMEGTAARLAAERGAEPSLIDAARETVAKLDACFGQSADDIDFENYSALNAHFHHQLARLCGSDMIAREVERATRLPFASPSAFLPDKAEIEAFRRSLVTAQIQHRAIVDAIAAREGARAEAVAREHARIARQNLDYLMTSDPGLLDQVPSLALVIN